MDWLKRFYNSTVGMKFVMAVSGAFALGWVVLHLVGNLQIYLGEHFMNHYAEFLHNMPELIWPMRLALLGAIVAHVISSIRLVQISAAARPIAYRVKQTVATTYAAKVMRLTGPVVLMFIVYHLAHLTWGNLHSDFRIQPSGAKDAYHNVVSAFQNPSLVALYICCQLALGLHLFHGAFAMFRTVGLNGERQLELAKRLALGLTLFIVLGNISIPLSVLLGWVK